MVWLSELGTYDKFDLVLTFKGALFTSLPLHQ